MTYLLLLKTGSNYCQLQHVRYLHDWNCCIWQAESSDLIAYGLIPEFVGRFPVLVSLSSLTENQLVQVGFFEVIRFTQGSFIMSLSVCLKLQWLALQVLTKPKNALGKQYRKMFQMNGVSFWAFSYLWMIWRTQLLPTYFTIYVNDFSFLFMLV